MHFGAGVKGCRAVYAFVFNEVRWVLGLAGPLALIGAITFFCSAVIPAGATATGLFYLVAVVITAASWGRTEALVASFAALACFDYFFLPPIRTFAITPIRSLEAFVAFLVSAIVASFVAADAAPHAKAETSPRQEMERLYALSRGILLMDAAHSPAKQIVSQIALTFEFRAVALYDRESGEVVRAGPEDMPGIEDKLREASVRGTLFQDPPNEVTVTAIRLGGAPIGSVAMRGPVLSDGALHALSNLVAIGLERVRGQEAANEAEAFRHSQELKSTLLDAIAHEFKTPLTSIKAAASALRSSSVPDLLERRELVTIIDEEADRLSHLVTEAIQTARVEGGKMQLSKGSHSVEKLIASALGPMQSMLEGREVRTALAAGLPPVDVDPDLIVLALRQLIDNAVRYSPAGSPVVLAAKAMNPGNVVISVADSGKGIAEIHHRRIFEPFYRVQGWGEAATGSGMGLAIARKILDAHAGEIWVESKPGQGSEFFISLPASGQETFV